MKIIKLPNGEFDWVAMFEESKFRTTKADIEIGPLERFVIDSQSSGFSIFEEPCPGGATVTTDEEAAAHAAELIILVMGAIRKGEKVGPYLRQSLGERKDRSNLFYPNKTTSTDPAWQIAKDRLLGNHTWDETFTEWRANVCQSGDRTIKDWVTALKPRIMGTFTAEEAQAYVRAECAKK